MKNRPVVITPDLVKLGPTNKSMSSVAGLLETAPEDWDFARADTQYLTHGLHPYPARMLPQIAERLISRYLLEKFPSDREQLLVLDPFCGSGTALVESKRLGARSVGNDINPLAVLLASVKTNPPSPEKLRAFLPRFLREIEKETKEGKSDIVSLEIPNIAHWFKDYVIKDLEGLRRSIQEIGDVDLRNFLRVCFSLTVMESSNIDLRSSRFIRVYSENELRKHKPQVLSIFQKYVRESVKRVDAFFKISKDFEGFVIQGDARKLPLANTSVDLVVTSPPYGEEKNTVAYTRWSKLSLYWLGLKPDEIKTLEKASLGWNTKEKLETPSETANEVLNQAARIDRPRATEAASFFHDYWRCLSEIHRVMKPQRYCCVVIGNRSIKRIGLDMASVTVELGAKTGFSHVKTYYRNIPKKLIPWTGPTGKTISHENIVILQRED